MFFLMPESASSAEPSSPRSDSSHDDDDNDEYVHPTTPMYSRKEMVQIIGDFYKFLTTLHVDESALKFPPPEGWPNITADSTAGFKKSPYVISLIKHLPYIDNVDSRNAVNNIHYKCDVVDYSSKTAADFSSSHILYGDMGVEHDIAEARAGSSDGQESGSDTEWAPSGDTDDHDDPGQRSNDTVDLLFGADFEGHEDEADEDVKYARLADIICIAEGYESYGRNYCLDLTAGIIREDVIRAYTGDSVNLEDFFIDLRGKFEQMELVPVPGEECYELGDDASEEFDKGLVRNLQVEEDSIKQFRQIYRDHGWPGPNYRKADALAAIEAHRQAREAAANEWDAKPDEEKRSMEEELRTERQRII